MPRHSRGQLPPRTVLVAHPGADVYGSDRMLVTAVSGLVDAGLRVIVALPDDGPLVPMLETAGADVRRCPTPVLRKSALSARGLVGLAARTLSALPAMVRLVRSEGVDVVYVNTVTIPAWLFVARALGRRVLAHVHEAEADHRESTENRVAVEPDERAADTVTVLVDGQAGGRQRECRADSEGHHQRADADREVPEPRPALGRALAAVLDRHGPEDQAEQHEHERQVQGGEQRGVPEREGGEGCGARGEQPDLVAVPDRADGVEHHAALGVATAREQHVHADTQVESLEHEVSDPQGADGDEPDGGQNVHD